jgi:hypothetical protein
MPGGVGGREPQGSSLSRFLCSCEKKRCGEETVRGTLLVAFTAAAGRRKQPNNWGSQGAPLDGTPTEIDRVALTLCTPRAWLR